MLKRWIAIIVIFVLLITAALIALFIQQNASGTALTYAEFLEMTPEEQQTYMESYDNIEDFLEWYRLAEEKYKNEQKENDVGGDGDIVILPEGN